MTDRTHSLLVILKSNHRVDDIEDLANAIRQLRGVIDVQVNVADVMSAVAESRARNELAEKLVAVVYGNAKKETDDED